MVYKINEIEGIGPSFAEKLAAASISNTDDLLEYCASKPGRTKVAEQTGIGEGQLLKWSNMADLMRIKGVGKQYAELLEASGVDTVKELRTRNAANLAESMSKINEERKLTKGTTSKDAVSAWISEAKSMEPKISH